jgi:hypothetical protein
VGSSRPAEDAVRQVSAGESIGMAQQHLGVTKEQRSLQREREM